MQYRPRIDCRRRSIDKKSPNPSGKQRRKTKRSGLGFFSSNPEHTLPLQKGIERFDYCELSSGQVSRSFLVVLGNSVDLVCSRSRGSRSRRLDVHLETVVTVFVGSMRTAGRVVSCTKERASTIVILVCRVGNRCKQAHFLLAPI